MLKTMEKSCKMVWATALSIFMYFKYIQGHLKTNLRTTEKPKNAIPKAEFFSLHCTSQSAPPSEEDVSGCASI